MKVEFLRFGRLYLAVVGRLVIIWVRKISSLQTQLAKTKELP
jgi:hypothetical protein